MAWKSLGKDAVNRNTKPIEWTGRKREKATIVTNVEYEFREKLKKYCEKTQITQSSLIRYLIAREMGIVEGKI